MVTVYLKAKTFEELIVKQNMMNKLSGKEYQFNTSFYAKNEFYIAYKSDIGTWSRISKLIDERLNPIKKNKSSKGVN